MNKKAEVDLGKIIEACISIIFLVIFVPVIISSLYSITHPEPQQIINNTAVEEAKNLSQQLEVCQRNFEELNNTILTKNDILDLTSIIKQTNQNVINIYETNHNYIKNYFSLTIQLTIALTLALSIGLFTLLDLTIFKMELVKTVIKVVKHRFTKVEVHNN